MATMKTTGPVGLKTAAKPAAKPKRRFDLASTTKPAFTQQNDNVAQNVNAVMAQDSPLMKQARTQGLQAANKRGLLNSSMAVGAAQDAVIAKATEIGGQQASQAFQKNLSRQGFTQDSALKVDDRKFQAQEADRDRDFTASQNYKDRVQQKRLQDDSQRFTRGQNQLDRNLQVQIGELNIKSANRDQVASTVTSLSSNYEQARATIMADKKLDAKTREAELIRAKKDFDRRMTLVEDLYNVDLKW